MDKILINEEYRKIFKNLKELYRRINDNEGQYPKQICGSWFVSHVYELVEDEDLRARLNPGAISQIVAMSNKLKIMPEMREKDVISLINLVKELENLQSDKLGL